MAASLLAAWRDRLFGRLEPRPCPYSFAAALDMPGRKLVASPARVIGAFGVSEGESVLEIGPGTAFYSAELARRVAPGGRLVCLDVQIEMLRHTTSRIGAQGLRAGCVQADARALPVRSRSLDRVVLITVLGEIPDRGRALAEIRRVLRRGGRLCVSEQFPDPDFVTRRTLRRELAAAGFRERETNGWLWYTSTWSVARPPATLRRATDADRHGIWTVHVRAIRETCSRCYSAEQVGAWAALLSPDSYAAVVRDRFVLVAEGPGGIAGFGQLDAERGLVEAVYVLPERQAEGIGAALLAALEAKAHDAGLTTLSLSATLNAVPFYQAAGFAVNAAAVHPLPGGTELPCVRMSKRLAERLPAVDV